MCGEVGDKMVTCRYWNRCRNPLELEREEGGEKKGRKEKRNKIGRREEERRGREGGKDYSWKRVRCTFWTKDYF